MNGYPSKQKVITYKECFFNFLHKERYLLKSFNCIRKITRKDNNNEKYDTQHLDYPMSII